jgi:transposase InsO family protein
VLGGVFPVAWIASWRFPPWNWPWPPEPLSLDSFIIAKRRVQYASLAYVEQLQCRGIQISMSAKGNAYDNAKAESFFKTLKQEEV